MAKKKSGRYNRQQNTKQMMNRFMSLHQQGKSPHGQHAAYTRVNSGKTEKLNYEELQKSFVDTVKGIDEIITAIDNVLEEQGEK